MVVTGSARWTPPLGSSAFSALFYVDTRITSDHNLGSDLFPPTEQDGYAPVKARIGLCGQDQRWSIELWGPNLFNQDDAQFAFNSAFQEGAVTSAFHGPDFPGGRQLLSQVLMEQRTYRVMLRGRF